MDKQLIEEARKERDLFCAVINSHERSIELRTACDSLLIMYDQLLDESTQAEDWVPQLMAAIREELSEANKELGIADGFTDDDYKYLGVVAAAINRLPSPPKK